VRARLKYPRLLVILLSCLLLFSIASLNPLTIAQNQSSVDISNYGVIHYSPVPIPTSTPTPTPTSNPAPTPTPPAPVGGLSTLHVAGSQLKDANGNSVVLRGVYYHSVDWLGGDVDENQFIYMSQWGANAVTLDMSCWGIEDSFRSTGTFPSGYLATMDNMVNWAHTHGLYVVLRWLHDGTTGTGFDRKIMSSYMDYFGYNNWLNLWQTLSTRYSGRGTIYCLAGEPLGWNPSTAQSQMRAAIDIIQSHDSTAICVCPAYDTKGDWSDYNLQHYISYPIGRLNVIYSFDDYAYHYTSNSQGTIRSYMSKNGVPLALQNGMCVVAMEFGGMETGTDYNVNASWAGTVASFSTTWLNNFMTVLDSDGCSGYIAWTWSAGWHPGVDDSAHALCANWNGTPNGYGRVIQTNYQAHESL
jgi:hypothetical protein